MVKMKKRRYKKGEIHWPESYLSMSERKREKVLRMQVKKHGKEKVLAKVKDFNDNYQRWSPDVKLKKDSTEDVQYVESLPNN